MAAIPAHVTTFWTAFLASPTAPADATERFYEAFRIGMTDGAADEGARLIVAGQKTATSGLLWEYEAGSKALPRLGALSVVENGGKEPVCVVETTSLEVVRFGDVDAQFAFDYGEGDRTLDGWRQTFWDYYADVCTALGREMSADAPLACERFRVIYP